MSDDKPLEEQVRHEVKHGVAWITLDRPEVQNAISPVQRDRLVELFNHASGDPFTRCVVTFRFGLSINPAVSFNPSAFTSEIAIPAIDSRERRTASARPMPEAAPVIAATLFFAKVIIFSAANEHEYHQ